MIVTDIDPFSPAFRADPYGHYARLRAMGRVIRLERHQCWCVPHHAEVKAVLGDWRAFSNTGGGGLANDLKEPPWRRPSLVADADPPDHDRPRRVLAAHFTAAAVARMKAAFTAVADRLVDQAIARGQVEAVEDLVVPFVLKVFPDAIGMPELDRDMMRRYGAIVFGAFGPVTDWYRALMADAGEVSAWIDAHCERDVLRPGGIGAALYAAHDDGVLTYDEARLLVRSLLSAGIDTTIDLLGLALNCLATHPDQFARLRADPSLARNAFEEATRFDSSSQSLFRTTPAPVELAGQPIDAQEKVMVLLGSAGRDPARWAEPDRFDIGRRLNGQVGYGWGLHACVAQMMARLEGEVLLGAVARAAARIEPAGPVALRTIPGLRGLTRLPLHLTPG